MSLVYFPLKTVLLYFPETSVKLTLEKSTATIMFDTKLLFNKGSIERCTWVR